jgi:PAS domain S-box-containing protein
MLNRVLWGIVIFGGIATVAGVFPLALEGRYGIVTLYMMCYVTIIGISVFKSLGYEIRALACLAVNYAIGLSEFYFFGISELSYAFMYTFVIFSGVLFGFRTGLGAITLVICSISIEYWHGMYQKAIRSGLTLDVAGILADWLSAMLTFSFLMLLSLAVISAMLQLLERSLADSNELVKNLRREVADRESAQQSLLKSERLYRLLADNVHDIIWTTDLYGNLTYVSPAMERMCGFTPEECIAGGIDVNGPPENTELFMTEVAKALAQEDKEPLASDLSRTFEIELYHKDGGTDLTP